MHIATAMSQIILLAGTLPLLLGLLMLLYWHAQRVYRGFGFWVLANISIGLGYLLLYLLTQVPDSLSIILGNALAVYGVIAIYEGTEVFFGRRPFNLLNHLVLGLYLVLQVYLVYARPDVNARIILVSSAMAALGLRVAYSLLAHSPLRLRPTCRTMALIFVLSALFSAGRGVYAAYQSHAIEIQTDLTLLAMAFGSICSTTI